MLKLKVLIFELFHDGLFRSRNTDAFFKSGQVVVDVAVVDGREAVGTPLRARLERHPSGNAASNAQA